MAATQRCPVKENLSQATVKELLLQCVSKLKKLSSYTTQETLDLLKTIADVYAKYPHLRGACALVLSEEGFCQISEAILDNAKAGGLLATDDVWFPVYYVFSNLAHYSHASRHLAADIAKTRLPEYLVGCISDSKYLNKLKDKNVGHVVRSSLTILHNVSTVNTCKQPLTEKETRQALAPFLTSNNETYKVPAVMLWAQLTTDDEQFDDELEKFGAMHLMWEYLCKSITAQKRKHKNYTPSDIVETITRMSITKGIKRKVIDAETLPLLVKMMQHDDADEQLAAAKLLWSLAFDKQCRRQIKDKEQCVEMLQQLRDSCDDEVRHAASGALWMIEEKTAAKSQEDHPHYVSKNHVYIVSAEEDEQRCLQIKEKLAADDITVVMSTDMVTLDEMALAMHQAYIILYCVSQHYKFNLRCRLESEYGDQLNKKFGICRMTSYRPEGELLEVLGEGGYTNLFDDDSFKEASESLLNNVQMAIAQADTQVDNNSDSEPGLGAFQSLMAAYLLAELQKAFGTSSDDSDDDSDDDDEYILKDNLSDEELKDYLEKCINGLKKEKDYTQPNTAQILKYMAKVPDEYPDKEFCVETLAEKGFPDLASKIIEDLFSTGNIENNERYKAIKAILHAIFEFTERSKPLAKVLTSTGIAKVLNEKCFLNKAFWSNQNDEKTDTILLSALCVIYNFSLESSTATTLRNENTLEALRPYTKSSRENIKILSAMTLVAVMDDDEKAEHADNEGAIPAIIEFIEQAVNNDGRKHAGFSVHELAIGLTSLSVCDKNKLEIVNRGALPLLMNMVKTNNTDEQAVACKILWNLAFDATCRQKIKEEEDCLSTLTELTNSECPTVRENADGALWVVLEKSATKQSARGERSPPDASKTDGHLFISYSHSTQQVCIHIKDRLEEDGYFVWMDVDKITGSMLDATSRAVEDAAVVLICVCDKYKQSPFCRTEAEYTHRENKPIVPLMMEKNYKPRNWLGALLGTRLYINFNGKISFDEAYEKLLKEIGDRGKIASTARSIPLAPTPQPRPATKRVRSVERWSCGKVKEWLRCSKLQAVENKFADFDGEQVLTMKRLHKEAPTYFFESLKSDMGLEFREVLLLIQALYKLDTM